MSWPVGTDEATPDSTKRGEDIERRIGNGELVSAAERGELLELKASARMRQQPTAQEAEAAYLELQKQRDCAEGLAWVGALVEKYGAELAMTLLGLIVAEVKR